MSISNELPLFNSCSVGSLYQGLKRASSVLTGLFYECHVLMWSDWLNLTITRRVLNFTADFFIPGSTVFGQQPIRKEGDGRQVSEIFSPTPPISLSILRPLPPRPGKPEAIYQEIPANGLKAPLAKEEEEENNEAKVADGEETGFLQPRAPIPSSVTEEDEDGYLKPNFHR